VMYRLQVESHSSLFASNLKQVATIASSGQLSLLPSADREMSRSLHSTG